MSTSMRQSQAQLWLALRLPYLSLNALDLEESGPEAVVVSEKQRVVCANEQALKGGITCGMDVTTAQLLGNCEAHPRAREREQQMLAALAERLYQFSPYIETYTSKTSPQAGLLLEISRCLKLFGGLKALTERIDAELTKTSYCVTYGLAHTAAGAWLLSYADYGISGDEDTALFKQRLKAVPVQWLHDYPQAVEALQKTGFNTLGDIAQQIDTHSISSIKKRLGQPFAQAFSDIFAIEQNLAQGSLFTKPATVYQPQEFFYDTLEFDYPVSQAEQLQWPMEAMLQNLSDYLRKRQLQCQHIEWTLYDIHHNSEQLKVYCDSAQSHWQLLYDLTRIQLEQKQLPFEVDALELTCRQTTAVQARSQSLVLDARSRQRNKSDRRSQNFALTAAKLRARLGESALYKISYRDSHIPEHSNTAIATGEACEQQLPRQQTLALRPTWLFDSPAPITRRGPNLYWRGTVHLLAGPERIEGNWWQSPTMRDYYLAERQDHLRLWVFLDLRNHSWYVQGVFG